MSSARSVLLKGAGKKLAALVTAANESFPVVLVADSRDAWAVPDQKPFFVVAVSTILPVGDLAMGGATTQACTAAIIVAAVGDDPGSPIAALTDLVDPAAELGALEEIAVKLRGEDLSDGAPGGPVIALFKRSEILRAPTHADGGGGPCALLMHFETSEFDF